MVSTAVGYHGDGDTVRYVTRLREWEEVLLAIITLQDVMAEPAWLNAKFLIHWGRFQPDRTARIWSIGRPVLSCDQVELPFRKESTRLDHHSEVDKVVSLQQLEMRPGNEKENHGLVDAENAPGEV